MEGISPACCTERFPLRQALITVKLYLSRVCRSGWKGGPHRAAGHGRHGREMRLQAGSGSYVNRCTMTALSRLASFSVWFSSASSLFGKVVMRTKLVAAMAGRASTMKSRMSLILVEWGGG